MAGHLLQKDVDFLHQLLWNASKHPILAKHFIIHNILQVAMHQICSSNFYRSLKINNFFLFSNYRHYILVQKYLISYKLLMNTNLIFFSTVIDDGWTHYVSLCFGEVVKDISLKLRQNKHGFSLRSSLYEVCTCVRFTGLYTQTL